MRFENSRFLMLQVSKGTLIVSNSSEVMATSSCDDQLQAINPRSTRSRNASDGITRWGHQHMPDHVSYCRWGNIEAINTQNHHLIYHNNQISSQGSSKFGVRQSTNQPEQKIRSGFLLDEYLQQTLDVNGRSLTRDTDQRRIHHLLAFHHVYRIAECGHPHSKTRYHPMPVQNRL